MWNRLEAEIAGVSQKAAIGRNFFTDVAPRTDSVGFRDLFEEGVKSGHLDVLFEWHLRGDTRLPTVQVHLKSGRSPNTYWIFTKRL